LDGLNGGLESVSRLAGGRTPAATSETMDVTGRRDVHPDLPLAACETRGGNGNDCSVGKRGAWSPEGCDGIAVGKRRPEPGVTGGESAATFIARARRAGLL
jgi:hypothetical protein